MQTQVTEQMTINAPASEVWRILAHEFDKIDQWSSGITESYALSDLLVPEDAPVGGRVCLSQGFGGDAQETFTY